MAGETGESFTEEVAYNLSQHRVGFQFAEWKERTFHWEERVEAKAGRGESCSGNIV